MECESDLIDICDTGRVTYHQLFAMDISPRMISITNDSIPSSYAVIGSFFQCPFKRGKFNYVSATGHAAGHVARLENFFEFLKEIKAILMPGGVIFLSLLNLYSMFVWGDVTTIAQLKKSNLHYVITESTMRVKNNDIKMFLLFPTADFVINELNAYCFDVVHVYSFSFQKGNYSNKMDQEADAFLFIARN